MTLGGLALAVGILVDDGTVTIENINYHLEQGKRIGDAILDGARMTQLVSAISCRRRNSSGGKVVACSAGSGMSRSGASNGTFAGSSLTWESELSKSARRCSAGTSAPPKRWRPPSAIGDSRWLIIYFASMVAGNGKNVIVRQAVANGAGLVMRAARRLAAAQLVVNTSCYTCER